MSRQLECPTCGDPIHRTHRCKGPAPRETPVPFDRARFDAMRGRVARQLGIPETEQLELGLEP